MTRVRWRKSSRSGNGGDTCVEVARVPGSVVTRDSTDPDGERLIFTLNAFDVFLADVKRGRHDL